MWLTLLLREPLRALNAHRLRSGLAMLGITIGVGAVVLVQAIGRAGSERVEAELRSLGDNLVWVEAGSRNVAGARTGNHGTTTLTLEDAEALRLEVPLLKRISPQIDGTVFLSVDNKSWTTRYRGETPEYLAIKGWSLSEGVPLTPEDVEQSASKILLGKVVRDQLFGSGEAVGRTVRISKQLFEVVGVLAPKGQSADGRDQDDWILLPHTTAQTKLRGRGIRYLDDILCSAVSPQAVAPAIEQVTALLRQRHHVEPGMEDDFNIRQPAELLKAQLQASESLEAFLLGIGSISLVVGGVGIMNVMLASMAQRTREIGIRMAVGATQRSVRVQFLGEALILCVGGGIAGSIFSAVAAFGFGDIVGWPVTLPLGAVALGLGASAAVGTLFGYYPAAKAAALDPIEALRHE